MKLIISEKPSTARTIAHVVGAREKIYGEGTSVIHNKFSSHLCGLLDFL